jgi:voltage-dependent calcium channel
MGIYDSEHSVRSILDDCQIKAMEFPRSVSRSGKVVEGIDLDLLNERLNKIPIADIQWRRARMNVFYQEILVSADPERGIPFTSLLMILAHYNVINDTKNLRSASSPFLALPRRRYN